MWRIILFGRKEILYALFNFTFTFAGTRRESDD